MLDGLQRGILRKKGILEKTKRKQRETNYSLEKTFNIKIKEQMSQRNCIIYTIKCFVWWFMRDMKVSILQKKYKTPDWWLKFIFSAVIACYYFIHCSLFKVSSNVTVAELFIRGIGGNQARANLSRTERILDNTGQLCNWAILRITRSIQFLLWPLNENFLFPEFLASCCQYLPLQEYCFQLNHWCEVNPASRKFMLGLCYLHFG